MVLGGKEQKAANKPFFQDISMEGPLPLGQVGVGCLLLGEGKGQKKAGFSVSTCSGIHTAWLVSAGF